MNFRKWFDTYCIPLVCLLGAVLFLTLGVMKLVRIHTFPTTTAVITRMEWVTSADPDSADTCDVYVKYTVRGTTYESRLDDYKSSYREGDTLTVYYNPEKPQEVLSPSLVGPVIGIGLGALLLFVGGGMTLRLVRTRKAEAEVC